VKLFYGKMCVERAVSIAGDMERLLPHNVTLALLREYLDAAKASLDQALWHYDHDKPSDLGLEAK